jgi:ABC-type sugar transport system substrate-binding protein
VNPVAGKQFRVAFSVPALSFPFFQVMERDIKEEASRLNVTIITYDGQDSTTKQTADIEAAIAQRVDGIIISPKDVDALVPVLEQAAAANIPIVTIDRTINKQDILLGHVGADNVEGGRLQAQYVLDRLKDRTEKIRVVVLRGTPGSSPERDRSRGIFEVFDANKDRVEVVFDQTAQFRRAEAANVMEAAITATGGQIDAVVAENDEMIEGASQVIRAKGLEGKVLMVGFDAISETLDHIKQGTIHATIEQWPGRQASGALNMLYDFLANGKRPAQKINLIKPTLITQDTINETEQ